MPHRWLNRAAGLIKKKRIVEIISGVIEFPTSAVLSDHPPCAQAAVHIAAQAGEKSCRWRRHPRVEGLPPTAPPGAASPAYSTAPLPWFPPPPSVMHPSLCRGAPSPDAPNRPFRHGAWGGQAAGQQRPAPCHCAALSRAPPVDAEASASRETSSCASSLTHSESRQLVSHSARPPSGLSQLLCARRRPSLSLPRRARVVRC